MLRQTLFYLLMVCFTEQASPEQTLGGKDPVAVTPSGVIRGSWMETRRGRRFEAYRGIRYAEPPVGELRFQPPQPILRYSAEVDARAEGPACPLPAPPEYYHSSAPLPVIVFIHPGGFYSMTGRSDLAGPHYLLDRDLVFVTINYRLASLGFLSTGDKYAPGNNGFKDQVAALRWVQRNIRAFGGDPNLVTAAGVSAGSISVVLHTMSPMARGLFHRGISISGSATGKAPLPRHQRELAVKQAQILGCPTESSKAIVDCLKTKTWRELGDSLPKFFEIGYDPVGLWGPVLEPDCGQERYLMEDPAISIQAGRMRALPLIVSQTTDEFSWFAQIILKNSTLRARMNAEWSRLAPISFLLPQEGVAPKLARLTKEYLHDKPLADDDASADGMGRLYVDSIMGFPIHRMANLLAKHSPKPVYYYQFAYIGNHSHWEDPITNKPTGAMHHDDMIYLFTLSYRFPTIPLGSKDDRIVDRMTAIWYNFARYGEAHKTTSMGYIEVACDTEKHIDYIHGLHFIPVKETPILRDPNPRGDTPELGNLRWPAMTPEDRRYLRVGEEFQVLANMNEDRYTLWEELYPLCLEN